MKAILLLFILILFLSDILSSGNYIYIYYLFIKKKVPVKIITIVLVVLLKINVIGIIKNVKIIIILKIMNIISPNIRYNLVNKRNALKKKIQKQHNL